MEWVLLRLMVFLGLGNIEPERRNSGELEVHSVYSI
jgi:hypothetical protein